MATIEKRTGPDGKPSYRAKVRLKGLAPQSATFTKLADARRWSAQTETALRSGRYFETNEAKQHTLAELIDRYIAEVLPRKAANSQEAQRIQLLWWRAELGSETLDAITPAKIYEAKDALSREAIPGQGAAPDLHRTREPATVKAYCLALSHCLTVAVKEYGWLDSNPLEKVTMPVIDNSRTRFLSDDERERLLVACRAQSADLFCAVVLALSTGCRKQESMGLTWNQIDFERHQFTLDHTKNGESRTVPLTGLAYDLLVARFQHRRMDTDLVFPGRDPAKAVDLRTPFDNALKEAGITDFCWHDLRHSCASFLAMSGASLLEIGAVLGHKSANMTKRYAHLSTAHTANVLESMTAKMFG
jgi:integrase